MQRELLIRLYDKGITFKLDTTRYRLGLDSVSSYKFE
jgi:hypothetical protein